MPASFLICKICQYIDIYADLRLGKESLTWWPGIGPRTSPPSCQLTWETFPLWRPLWQAGQGSISLSRICKYVVLVSVMHHDSVTVACYDAGPPHTFMSIPRVIELDSLLHMAMTCCICIHIYICIWILICICILKWFKTITTQVTQLSPFCMMSFCIHISICIHVFVCIYIGIHICIHICICVCIFVCVCISCVLLEVPTATHYYATPHRPRFLSSSLCAEYFLPHLYLYLYIFVFVFVFVFS